MKSHFWLEEPEMVRVIAGYYSLLSSSGYDSSTVAYHNMSNTNMKLNLRTKGPALDSLLDELKSLEETTVFHAGISAGITARRPVNHPRPSKAAGKPQFNTRYLSTCKCPPSADRRAIAHSHLLHGDYSDVEYDTAAETGFHTWGKIEAMSDVNLVYMCFHKEVEHIFI